MKNRRRKSNSPKNSKRKEGGEPFKKKDRAKNTVSQDYSLSEKIRINKFIAHAGLCSRREADRLIEEGKVTVNGKVISELGMKVSQKDEIVVDGQTLSLEPFVYLLLNKSKNTITTTDDEKGRNTVMDEVETATGYRVYPVGRLDRNERGNDC